LKNIVVRGSEIRPLIMAFEDLHWVDKSSEAVLKSLLETIPATKVLLLFTFRPDFVHTWGAKSFHSQLNLVRLSNRESLLLVRNLLGTESISGNLEDLILEKTEGVPFFIEEFLKSLRELGIIEKKDDSYHIAADIKDVKIPSTIQDVIMARVDSLPEGAKELLQTASVIDREFSYELIKRVVDLPEEGLLSHLSCLRDCELLYERGVYPKNAYIFKHALTQEVAYNSLLLKRRKDIHEHIGRIIEGLYEGKLEEYYELLAYHYMRSDDKEKTVEYLGLASNKATTASAMEDAKAYFEEAMRLLDTLPDTDENRVRRISLLNSQWTGFQMLLQIREYHELLAIHEDQAANLSDLAVSGAFYARLAYTEFSFSSFERAISLSRKAVQLYEAAGKDEEAGFAYMVMQWSSLYMGELERTVALKEKILRKEKSPSDLQLHIRALAASSMACTWLGRWEEAEAGGQEALQLARKASDNYHVSYAAQLLALCYILKGDLELGIEYTKMTVEKSPTPAYDLWARACLAWAKCRRGEINKTIETITEALSLVRMGHGGWGEFVLLIFLSEGHLYAGQYEKARQVAEEAQEMTRRCGARVVNGWAHTLLGEVALEIDLDEAAPYFEKAISVFGEAKAEDFLARAHSGMGRFHKKQGNTEQAREYLTKALEIFERLGTLIEPDKVRKELAELPK
jgi:predicted ATPase